MQIDKLIVGIGGIGLSAFIYWYFLMNKELVTEAGSEITINVDGGYNPKTIKVKKNKTTKLKFFRKDPSSCLEEVVLPEFGKQVYLPLNETTVIEIKPEKSGTYEINCGMNMFHGKIIVE